MFGEAFWFSIILVITTVVVYQNRTRWVPWLKKELKGREKFQWITSYYSIKGTDRYHIHIVPLNDGDHFEDEVGDCRCHPNKIRIEDRGLICYHKQMTRL